MTITNSTNVITLKKGNNTINIKRTVKEGTKRVFFYPETIEGKKITRTLFARLYDAERLAFKYLEHISK